jgi:hypothetical protein
MCIVTVLPSGFAQKLLRELSPTAISASTSPDIALQRRIGVGDASHTSSFMQSRARKKTNPQSRKTQPPQFIP